MPEFTTHLAPAAAPRAAAPASPAANRARPAVVDSRTRAGGAAPLATHSNAVMAHAMRYAAEAMALAAELVANGTGRELGLTASDLALLGVERLKQLKASAAQAREFDGYDMNELLR